MCAGAISAGFRLERRFFDSDGESQAAHHVVEHMIVLIAQPVIADLQSDVTITEVIGRTREIATVNAAHRRHGFICGNDFNDTAIIGQQQVTTAQHRASFQEQAGLFTIQRCT